MAATREAIRELTADLVAIETENPPGNEAPCAEYVRDWFDARGIQADLVDAPDPDRPQVAAQVGTGDPTVVLNGHLDVVPAGDHDRWTYPPYTATVEAGRLYGRGSADMKAGVALAMLTANELKDDLDNGTLPGSVVVHGAMGEETAEPGTRTLLEQGYDGDYGVCLEATGMRTATSEKGLAWYEITVAGEPAHASRPDQGRNAIRLAQPVLEALESYDRRIRERTDDLVGAAYATPTMIQAGTKENVVPEETTITIDRRFLPTESIAAIDDEIASLCADIDNEYGTTVSWKRTRLYESAAIPVDSRIATVFRKHSAEIADVSREPYGTRASTDVRNLITDAGMEAITWGPGDLDQAHTYDEHIDLTDVETGARVLERAVRELLQDR